jgi:SAM-dependent methyltransferase
MSRSKRSSSRPARPTSPSAGPPATGSIAANPAAPGLASPRLLLMAATFLGSFLLFQVQPLIGKLILPWLGGTAAVWTVCLLFFQATLFAGYAYAHWTTAALGVRRQLMVHGLLVLAAVASLPIVPDPAWRATVADAPTATVLQILAASVGLPFLLLSTTAPLVQRWWSLVETASPYRLYALSNIGSLLALLTYSFAFERTMGTHRQAYAWSALFVLLALLLLACMVRVWRQAGLQSEEQAGSASGATSPSSGDLETGATGGGIFTEEGGRPTWRRRVFWLFLSGLGTTSLMAVSNFLCQDVSSVPFLWIAPLTLYLLTFILCFGQARWYRRRWFVPLMIAGTYACAIAHSNATVMPLRPLLLTTLPGLFLVCMGCHGELERSKPSSSYLTEFYLYISAGGMLGGLFVGIVAPLLFFEYYELPMAMIAALLLALAICFLVPTSPLHRGKRLVAWAALLLVFAAEIGLWSESLVGRHLTVWTVQRNFYGVLKTMPKQAEGSQVAQAPKAGDSPSVSEDLQARKDLPTFEYVSLVNGLTEHGGQFVDEARESVPTSYYGRGTGLGQAMRAIESRANRRIGVVGLGTGTIAAFGREGDTFRFYEINPAVVPLAERVFTYLPRLQERGGQYEIAMGDARLSLESEPPQQFDLLVIDAFAGDSIPVHLLTVEALEVYLRHLKPDGILAVHVSNRFLDLTRVTRALAWHGQLDSGHLSTPPVPADRVNACDWVLYARPGAFAPQSGLPLGPPVRQIGPRVLWTDDHSSLFDVLR